MEQSTSSIVTFYKNRSVFLTGATGFLGKAIIEKLLRTCSEIDAVYVLIRPKKGSDVRTRLEELLESSLYNTIKRQNHELFKKIVPISGDIALPNLGLSENDKNILIDKTSVVIHSAATVKFDEKLKHAVNLNVLATQRVVELCKQMSKLEAFVHVSTAYANCERHEIDEVVYPPNVNPTSLIKWLARTDEDTIDKVTPQLIGNKPNTYTFTKSLAEHLLVEEAQNLPVCIIRPSIVTATWKEPFPGWVDNLNGPTGLMLAIGKGTLRTVLCRKDYVTDMIPLEYPVNLILCAAWHIAENKPEGIPVYNCCSGTENPLFWRQFEKSVCTNFVKTPFNDVFWYPAVSFTTNQLWHQINDFFLQYLPAHVLDIYAILSGRKSVMLKMYRKLTGAVKSLEYFTINQWRFKTDNMVALYEIMSPEDKRLFCLDMGAVNWSKYFGKYCLGIRKYIMKDDDWTLLAARKYVQKLGWLHKFTKLCVILMFWRVALLYTLTLGMSY